MVQGTLKALFIINHLLEKKTKKNVSELIGKYLDKSKIEPTIIFSEYAGHTKDLARENIDKYHMIVAGGGDGTVNEICQSLVNTDTILGILPLGSGRGLARSLGIPMSIADAIRTLNKMNIVRIDSGIIGDQRFVNIAGIGFAAEVAHAYAGIKRRGFFSYALNLARKLPAYSPVPVKISIENRIVEGKYFDVSIANSTQWGYGAHISPHSKPDDGWLDICLLKSFPKILIPGLLLRSYLKSINKSKYMKSIPAKTAEILGNGSYLGHVDGEPLEFKLPIEISVIPGSLNVVSGGKN